MHTRFPSASSTEPTPSTPVPVLDGSRCCWWQFYASLFVFFQITPTRPLDGGAQQQRWSRGCAARGGMEHAAESESAFVDTPLRCDLMNEGVGVGS